MKYRTPAGTVYTLFEDMLEQKHLLIAGATGSGKSVVVNGMIYTGLYKPPTEIQFILIDPKRVELSSYKPLPHCIYYASEPDTMIIGLQKAMQITEYRYKVMQRERVKKYQGADVYVIIDELADLMTTNKKQVQPLIQRLCQIGRAARVHVVACTQTPVSAVIPTPIKVNFDSRVGLRTRSKQDSRNIIEVAGLETLPEFGQGVYMTSKGQQLYNIPYITDEQMDHIINWWLLQTPTQPRRWFTRWRRSKQAATPA